MGQETKAGGGDEERYGRAMAYMRGHFRTARVADVAAAVGVSQFHFHRGFTRWAGRTPKAVMSGLQVEHAKALMRAGDLSLAEVAERCGFTAQSHLTGRFKHLVGQTPGRWRDAQRAGGASDDDARGDARREAA